MSRWKYNIYELCDAAGDGRVEDVEKHLQNGVDVNGRGSCDGETPLYRAAEHGHLEVVELLISRGAKVNCRHDNGDTPLNKAMRGGHSQVVKFLLSKGATYDIRGLLEAAGDGRLEDVKEHLQNGVDVNGRDWNYETPLCKAVSHNHWEIVELLLSEGAQVDQDKELRSAIRNYEKAKKNTVAVLQKCITKAKNQKGKISVRFIKILFTGSGAAGKTSFSNLLMKNKFVDFHHSTNIVQAKHAVSVKKAIVVGSNQSHDQNIVWLEMDDDSQISHLKEILLSFDVQSLPNSNETNPPPHNKEPQLGMTSPSNNQNNNTQEAPVRGRNSIIRKHVTGWFQGSVKSEKLLTFNSLVQRSVMLNTTDHCFDLSGEVLNIITLLDTGGQPQYIHLLPTINIHPMVNFVIHDLSKNLEDQVLVEYSENGKLVFEPYRLRYSNFDMIKFLMSSINDSLERASSQVPQLVAVPGKNNRAYLCCVGTHADKVDTDTIHNIDIQLTAMIEKLHCKTAIWENKDGGILFSVDNTTAGNDNQEDPTASFIRKKIDDLATDKDIYELPITWILFELEIQKLCSSSGRTYVSFEECCSVAHQTNLLSGMEEIKSALMYHHMLGVLLYYPDIPGLCDYVITDHQWLFDKITNIVYCTFEDSSDKLAKNNLKHNGI